MPDRCYRWVAAVALLACCGIQAFADLEGSYILPQDDEAIKYSSAPLNEAIAELQKRIAGGRSRIPYDEEFGYLPGLLRELNIPVSSQVLVFSKTSFQAPRISPRTPRALYFNDTVAVGFVKGGDVLEVSALDAKQGVVFYTLEQQRKHLPVFLRRDDCLQCHASSKSLGIPGNIVRSVYPDSSGFPLLQAGSFSTDHRSPLKERWGGWYVTGKHGSQTHMGNKVVSANTEPITMDTAEGANLTDLRGKIDTGAYLSPHSDLVALMVMQHQCRMQNLITRVGWETRMALNSQDGMNRILGVPSGELSESTMRRINNPAEYLIGYMLFTDEALLDAPVEGTSGFTKEFSREGPKDKQGRSLRDFDLTRRMFRYPCSYMIYSEAFDSLPDLARERIYRRLWEILTGKDRTPAYSRLTGADRKAILEILLDTKKNLPAYWRQ